MKQNRLLVGVDVGCRNHHVAIGGPSGIVDQFKITHNLRGFECFFNRIAEQARRQKLSTIVVGMEGTNGYARPLDQMVKAKGYHLLNVNNLKMARFKEIFASPAKTDCNPYDDGPIYGTNQRNSTGSTRIRGNRNAIKTYKSSPPAIS